MNCKHCKGSIPERTLHFANQLAIENGYCCWMCFLRADEKKANKALVRRIKEIKKIKEEMKERFERECRKK